MVAFLSFQPRCGWIFYPLVDMAEGQNIIEISDILPGETRSYSFRVSKKQAVPFGDLDLPIAARAI
jgi:hypothetical protein